MKLALFAAVATLTALSGCSWYDNRNIETPPVTLATEQGPIICQLYREDMVIFDRAWIKPETMTTTEANDLCQAEGKRIKDGGKRDHTERAAGFKSEPSQ